ncbi:MAG TPA: DUF1844 domain-containing protein [bacterium]|nr:DUF1844 domain-containing protein [bacterium]
MDDRDRVAAEQGDIETPPASPGEPASARQEAPDTPGPAGEGERAVPIAALGTEEIMISFLGLLAAKAWEGMGLVPAMRTGKVEKDLASARLAIDGYGAVFDLVRGRLPEAPRREMETLLTNLRVNFVDKSTK